MQSGGAYTTIAQNLPDLTCADSGLASGTTYYYVVTATNIYGESGNSSEASAQTISTAPPQLTLVTGAGQIQLSWPMDHLGWQLETQTNSLAAGIGGNWVTVPGSTMTNQMVFPLSPNSGGTFFRLAYP